MRKQNESENTQEREDSKAKKRAVLEWGIYFVLLAALFIVFHFFNSAILRSKSALPAAGRQPDAASWQRLLFLCHEALLPPK